MIRKFIPSARRLAPLTLALVVLLSAVGSPALAATETATETYSGPTEQKFTTGPHKVKIDLSDVSTETTITVITDESPAGNNTAILKKTVSGLAPSAHFRNAGAYEEFTVRVEGADAEPSLSKGGVTDAWTAGSAGKFLGDTGGDADFTYDLSEQIGEALNPQIVQLDRTGLPDSTTVDTTGSDASQIKLDIYQSAQNTKAQDENYKTTMNNYLQDTKTQARIIGKNAYIRALNNGTSKSAAKTEAKNAVDEYYADKQENIVTNWNNKLRTMSYLTDTARSESGVSDFYPARSTQLNGISEIENKTVLDWTYSTEQLTLVDGDTVTSERIRLSAYNPSGPMTLYANTGLTDGAPNDGNDGQTDWMQWGSAYVQPHDSNADRIVIANFTKSAQEWNAIESQASTVRSDMDTLAENTYSAYQNGEINNSDLVDPYVLASQQSAGEDFQGWTAAQLTLLGTNSPDNFDQIGSFNVTHAGTQYEGVLFSQENPTSGEFAAGNTYDASTLGGSQYVVTSEKIVELDGQFTINGITSQDGQQVQNVTIQKTQYTTTNTTELKQLYDDLAERRAEIEAREQNMMNSGGGALLGGSNTLGVVLLGGVALILIASRDGDD